VLSYPLTAFIWDFGSIVLWNCVNVTVRKRFLTKICQSIVRLLVILTLHSIILHYYGNSLKSIWYDRYVMYIVVQNIDLSEFVLICYNTAFNRFKRIVLLAMLLMPPPYYITVVSEWYRCIIIIRLDICYSVFIQLNLFGNMIQ